MKFELLSSSSSSSSSSSLSDALVWFVLARSKAKQGQQASRKKGEEGSISRDKMKSSMKNKNKNGRGSGGGNVVLFFFSAGLVLGLLCAYLAGDAALAWGSPSSSSSSALSSSLSEKTKTKEEPTETREEAGKGKLSLESDGDFDWSWASSKDELKGKKDETKCSLAGDASVPDCNCHYHQVDVLNEEVVRPKLSEIVSKRFFRYFKVDLHCSCPFWPEDGMCALPACSVCECPDDELPQHLVAPRNDILECKMPFPSSSSSLSSFPGAPSPALARHSNRHRQQGLDQDQGQEAPRQSTTGSSGAAFSTKWESQVDRTVGRGVSGDEGMKWEASDNPWLFSKPYFEDEEKQQDQGQGQAQAQAQANHHVYVDLKLNPERFTGYKGEHANRIWAAIYSQGCFQGLREGERRTDTLEKLVGEREGKGSADGGGVCKEKEIFYKLISGIHSSITAHIAAEHPREICGSHAQRQSKVKSKGLFDFNFNAGRGGAANSFANSFPAAKRDWQMEEDDCVLDEQHWGPHLNLFYNRLGKKEHKSRVENLYFVYLFTLQAAVKAAPYLLHAEFSTGYPDEDSVTKTMVKSLLSNERLVRMCTKAFDEGMLWNEGEGEAKEKEKEKGKGKFQSPSRGVVLQEEMQLHFQNISQIMNCVGCEKCKLWGKLQIVGLGTAMKILFNVKDLKHLVLTRNEVIAFFNLLARLSESIRSIKIMLCTLLDLGYQDVLITDCNNM